MAGRVPPDLKELMVLQAANIVSFLDMVTASNSEYESLEHEALILRCALGLSSARLQPETEFRRGPGNKIHVDLFDVKHLGSDMTQTLEIDFEEEHDAHAFLDRFREMMRLSGKPSPDRHP